MGMTIGDNLTASMLAAAPMSYVTHMVGRDNVP